MQNQIEIAYDDLSDGKIIELLSLHRQDMLQHSPVDSVHALDSNALHHGDLTFWQASIDMQFAACGGLKRLTSKSGEIKSMKTADGYERRGLATALLTHIIEQANARDYTDLYLETGTMDAFIPARTLYQSMGFKVCPPFADYQPDAHSVCMRLNLISN